MAAPAPASASDTKEVTNSLDKFVCLCNKNVAKNATLYRHNDKNLATVDSEECHPHPAKLKNDFDVCEISDMFCFCPRTTEDGGTYLVDADGKKSTFKLQNSSELAEPTVTSEVQNCSHEFCGCCLFSSTPRDTISMECFQNIPSSAQPRAESPVLMEELPQKELKWRNCTAWNPVRNGRVTVTTPRVLHSAITTDPPSTDAHSGNSVWITVTVTVIHVFFFVVPIFLGFCCKSKVPCMKGRRWGSVGSQGDSHGAAGDIDTQAEESDGGDHQPFGAIQLSENS